MRLKSKIFLIASVLIIILLFIPKDANASGYSLSIYPTTIRIKANSPAIVKTGVIIKNLSDNTAELSYILKPFVAGNNNSDKVNYLLYSDYTSREAKFLQRVKILEEDQPVSKITLSPKQEKNLTIYIDVPKEEESKDHYFSLVFLTQDKNNPDSTYSQIVEGIGINVLISINPKEYKARIKNFSTSSFISEGPVKFNVEVENTEQNFINSSGYILITNIFGQNIGKVNLGERSILAKSTVNMSNEKLSDIIWKENLLLGRYKAKLIINYENSPTLIKETAFISIPVRQIIILTIIGFFVILVRKKLKTS